MDLESNLFQLLLITVAIAANALFVASEFALARSRMSKIQTLELELNKNTLSMKLVKGALANINDYISAAQIGITIASLIVGAVSEKLFSHIFHYLIETYLHFESVSFITIESIAFVFAIATATFLHVILGEFIPKTLAIQNAESIALQTILPLHLFYKFTKPIVFCLNALAILIMRPFGIGELSKGEMIYSEDEIKYLVRQSEKHGVIESAEREMVNNVFEFGDTVVREIMTPRTVMLCLPDTITVKEAVQFCIENQKSKVPIYKDGVDDIVGMIYIPDLLNALQKEEDELNIQYLIKPLVRIPESKLISNLLSEFKNNRSRLALVIDEFGGTSGLVTLQDILEEIVGDIELDEAEVQEEEIESIRHREWLVRGATPIDDINKELNSTFINEHFDTIGGFVFGLLDREPEPGDSVRYGDWLFTITQKDKKIEQIHILLFNNIEESEE